MQQNPPCPSDRSAHAQRPLIRPLKALQQAVAPSRAVKRLRSTINRQPQVLKENSLNYLTCALRLSQQDSLLHNSQLQDSRPKCCSAKGKIRMRPICGLHHLDISIGGLWVMGLLRPSAAQRRAFWPRFPTAAPYSRVCIGAHPAGGATGGRLQSVLMRPTPQLSVKTCGRVGWGGIGSSARGGGGCARPTTTTCIPQGGVCVWGPGG